MFLKIIYLKQFLYLFLSLCVISCYCNQNIQDDEKQHQTLSNHHQQHHQHHESYDINNAPMPSLHDGPQHHVDRILQITSTEKIKYHEQHHQFVHKIENSPLPAAHEGPQPLKMSKRKRSAPMALDNKFNKDPKDGDEVVGVIRELTSGEISMNPQKPKNADETTTTVEVGNNLIQDVYGYYGVNGRYGGRFEYKNDDNDTDFEGYYPTKNIGIIPPKNVKSRDYYNKISGLEPIFNQHGGVYSKFLIKNETTNSNVPTNLPKYGNGEEIQFNSNAYQNVLNGLLIWNSMQNQNNNQSINENNQKNNTNEDNDKNVNKNITTIRNNTENDFIFYTHENITKEINASISVPLERIPCENYQAELCLDDFETFCTKEKYVFCTIKIKTQCIDNNSCKNENVGNDMKCLKNVTLHNNRVFEDLCFISIAIVTV